MAEVSALETSAGVISIRPMTPQDIPFGLRLSLAAGWNQVAADWLMLLEQSEKGSYLACFDGVEAGTVTTVSYPGGIHWIGMMLVAEEFRQRGVGRALLRAAIQSVRGRGAIWLDATPIGKILYDKMGFQDVYSLARWLRQPAGLGRDPVTVCRPLSPEMLPFVGEYDRPVFGADRSGVLSILRRNAPELAFYTGGAGRVSGYCLGRHGRKYTQIGPVIADRLDIAQNLLLSALRGCAERQVILDAACQQPGWNEMLRELDFVEQRQLFRMSLGDYALPKEHARQFAIAGPEMG